MATSILTTGKCRSRRGIFFTVRDILKEFRGPAVRLFMLSAHYRNPINFSRELLTQSETAYDRILNCRENLKFIMEHPKDEAVEIAPVIAAASEKFNAAMDDDLNTADAIGGIFEYIKEINTLFESGGRAEDAKRPLRSSIRLWTCWAYFRTDRRSGSGRRCGRWPKAAGSARQKNWAEADRLRDEVRTRGV